MPTIAVPTMLKSARLAPAPAAATPKIAAEMAKDAASRAHGAHVGSLPEVSEAALAEAGGERR